MPLRFEVPLAFATLAALLVACSKPADTAVSPARPQTASGPAAAPTDAGIAWKRVATDAEVDAAFAQALAEARPVLVYWGAKWCPPCNQLSATVFNRRDFIERSRAFVPVYVDGDSPGAQKLGTRFKVRGYPTMVLFSAQGTELTRLPGEVDAALYTQMLTLGMNAQRSVKAVLADARAGGEAATRLSANDWKLLAFYSWETDEQQVLPRQDLPALLRQLAAQCPAAQTETAARLLLKALAAAGADDAKAVAMVDAAHRTKVLALLADPAQARTHMDVLANNAAELARALSAAGTPERAQLLGALHVALRRLSADATLSRADRMTAVIARVALARIDAPKDARPALPDALLAEVREHSARADRDITDGYERQAVIPTAAYLLEQAGLLDESDQLLQANLAKSHSPYYLMSALAGNASQRGDKAAALRWSEEAFNKSEGPATRLQWGAAHLGRLVEWAPRDEARIEMLAQQLLGEAAAQPDAFHERSARSLQRVGARLQAWNGTGAHGAVLKRLQTRLDAVCQGLPGGDPQRQTCEALLRPGAKPAG